MSYTVRSKTMKAFNATDVSIGFRFDESLSGRWFKEVVEVIKSTTKKILVKVMEDDGFIQYITFEPDENGVICDGNGLCYSHTTSLKDALYFFER